MKKRLLSILLCACMVLMVVTPAFALESSFEDMPEENHWSYTALKSAVENGLIKGYAGKLNSTAAVTRAQIAAVLNRAFGATEAADISKFTDVTADKWYYSELAKALKMGTFNGNTDNKFLPENDATRQEAFCVIARALSLSSADLSPLDKFSDKNDIADWAKGALAALTKNGYVNGNGGALNPNAKITLAEFAKLMDNVFKSYISVKGTFSPVTEGNVMINCPDVVLKNAHIKGDLILGDGVGKGDITVDNTKVDGRLIVRGGGKNSIKLINNTDVGTVVICKTASGAVRVATESGAKVDVLIVDDGADDVIIEGTFGQVVVSAATPVVLNNAVVSELSVDVPAAEVKVAGSTKIKSAKVAETAAGTKIDVAKGASVQKLNSAAPAFVIGGEGKVVSATVSGADTQVNTKGTEVTVAKGTEGVTAGNKTVEPGSSVKTPDAAPGGSNTPADDSTAVTSLAEFTDALADSSVTKLKVTQDITLKTSGEVYTVDKPVVVNSGATLTIGCEVYLPSTLTNKGTVLISGADATRGTLHVYPGTVFENNNIVENNGTIVYHNILGATAPGNCTEIQNVTGTGSIVREAVVYTQAALEAAVVRMDGANLFYTDIVLAKDPLNTDASVSYALTAEYIISAGHTLTIGENTALTVPSGTTLTIEPNAELLIEGSLVIAGSCVNKGLCSNAASGTINGYIDNVEGGKCTRWLDVTTEAQLQAAVGDNDCTSILVTANILITSSIDITKEVTVAAGKTLTIEENKQLGIRGLFTVEFGAKLVNHGTIVIDNNSNLFVENEGLDSDHHGLLDNSNGIIDLRSGWLSFRDFNGNATPWFTPNLNEAVRTYYNLADVARELYYQQHDFNANSDTLPTATEEEIAGYRTAYTDWSELQNEFNDDIHGVTAIAMLLKNGILTPSGTELHPYDAVTKIQAIELVYNYAKTIINKSSLTAIDTGSDIVFNDISGLSEAQKIAISYLAKAGILTADADGNLNPDFLMSSVCGEKINSNFVEYTELNIACNRLMNKLSDQEIVVTNIEQLKSALNSTATNKVIINGDITLDANMTITRDVEIASGAALRTGTYNLTIGYETAIDAFSYEYMSDYGRMIVKGTLDVPVDSTLYNLTEIRLEGGTLSVGGTYVDRDGNLIDEQEQTGSLEGTNATLTIAGSFANSGTVRLSTCAFTNTGAYTNNGILEVTGGSIASTAGSFTNAGQFRIEDVYGDENNVCNFNIENTLTSASEWIEYVGIVTTEQGLREALAYHKQRYDERKGEPNPFGLNYYDRIDINDDITISDSLDVQDVDLYVNRIEEYVEGEDSPRTKVCTLTNNNYINLKNSNLLVYGQVLNNGTINVGVVPGEELEGHEVQRGSISVQPLGVFENTCTLNLNNGEFLRYDELNADSDNNGYGKNIGETINVANDIIKHVAIVHDITALKQAAAKNGGPNYTEQEYDQIEIIRGSEEADIVLDGNLTVDADLYIEWGSGIEVPENCTLNFTGDDHYIENQGDIWVYGNLNLGAGYRLVNQSKIQVGGSQDVTNTAKFVNAGIIDNANLIEVLSNGKFENNGTIFNAGNINVNGGNFTGTGEVYNEQNGHATGVLNVISIAQSASELQDLISSNTKNILICGEIVLSGNITIPNEFTVYLGKLNYRYGELKTGDSENPESHTIIVEDGAKLVLCNGCLEINCSSTLLNRGTIECGEEGNIRIENRSSLMTNTNIDVKGSLDLYDWENKSSYITGSGKITVYSEIAAFMENLFLRLYEYKDRDENDNALNPPVIIPKTDLPDCLKQQSDITSVYSEFEEWFQRNEGGNNYLRRYAYAAMKANRIISGAPALGDGEAHYPYEKLTYAYVKSVLSAAAGLFADIDDDRSIVNYVTELDDSADLVPHSFGCDEGAFNESNVTDDILNGFFETVRSAFAKVQP